MSNNEEQSGFWRMVKDELRRLEVYVATPSLLNAEPTFDPRAQHGEVYVLGDECATAEGLMATWVHRG